MCKNPLKRKVTSQFLNILAQFLRHYRHFCRKKKVMRHPKVRREGTRNNFVFLCGLKQRDSITGTKFVDLFILEITEVVHPIGDIENLVTCTVRS